MSEYVHRIYKDQPTGFTSDPPQDLTNTSDLGLDTPLTARNAIVIGLAASAGKRIVTTGFNAVVDQFGNSTLERYIDIGTGIATYAVIGAATGGIGIAVKAAADIGVKVINDAVNNHQQNLENQRIEFTRGELRNLGTSGYYD